LQIPVVPTLIRKEEGLIKAYRVGKIRRRSPIGNIFA